MSATFMASSGLMSENLSPNDTKELSGKEHVKY
jgi:hypothetical protein